MWILDINVNKWLSLHPSLEDELPFSCLCGKEIIDFKPFISRNWVGLISNDCVCGLKSTSISIPRDKKTENEIKCLLRGFVR